MLAIQVAKGPINHLCQHLFQVVADLVAELLEAEVPEEASKYGTAIPMITLLLSSPDTLFVCDQDNDGNEHLAQAPADISVQQVCSLFRVCFKFDCPATNRYSTPDMLTKAADQEVQPHTEGFPPRGRGRSRGRGRGRGRRR